jgi:predicted metal-dependent hydrolase
MRSTVMQHDVLGWLQRARSGKALAWHCKYNSMSVRDHAGQQRGRLQLTNRVATTFTGDVELPINEILTLPGGPTRVQWRRNGRARRISLRIDSGEGRVVVTLPPRAGRRAGMSLLMTHADWVSDRLARLPSVIRFDDGASFPLDGKPCLIRHVPDARGAAWLADGELHVTGAPEFLARRVNDFLRAEARRRFTAVVAVKAASTTLHARRVIVKDTKSRWGSCASDGSIALCWRLIMAPDFVQDYVVAHEVAHLRYMNHAPRFWDLVAQLTPYTAVAMEWLRNHGAQLQRIGG